MQKLFYALLLVALIALGTWGWRTLFPGPRSIIRSRLSQLAKTASFDRNDGGIARVNKARRLPEFLAPDVVINLDLRGSGELTLSGRDQVQEAVNAALFQGRLGTLKIEFQDVSVTLGADGQTAVANLTCKAFVEGWNDFVIKELDISFRKMDGKWLICRIETVKTLVLGHPSSAMLPGRAVLDPSAT
jgi:hypothetical protein